jgi:hypothetical protein
MPVRNIGVKLLFDSFLTALEGPGRPYLLTLEYQSRQPPQHELRIYTYERTLLRLPCSSSRPKRKVRPSRPSGSAGILCYLSSTRLGFHAGFEIVLFSERNFGIGGEIRYYLCPDYDVAGELALLKKPGSHIRELDLAAQNIPVSALRMNPSFLKLGFTIRLRL